MTVASVILHTETSNFHQLSSYLYFVEYTENCTSVHCWSSESALKMAKKIIVCVQIPKFDT